MAVCHAESVCSKEEVSVAAAALNNNNKKRVCCIASLSRPTTVKSSLQSRPVQTQPPAAFGLVLRIALSQGPR